MRTDAGMLRKSYNVRGLIYIAARQIQRLSSPRRRLKQAVNVSTAKPVPIRLVISRPYHRPIYQPTAHLSHITAVNHLAAVNHCILRPLTPADRQPNACGTADRGGGCTWQVLLQIYIDS